MADTAEAVRRILDVDVKEVSLVDRAANLRQFLVIKRLSKEDESMGAFASEKEILKAKKQEEEMSEEEMAEAEKEKKKKQDEKEAEEKEAKKEADEKEAAKKDAKMKQDAEKAMNPKALAGMLQALKGAPKGPVSQLVSWLESTKKAEGMDDEEYKDKTQKNLEGVQVAVMDDGSVVVSGQPVAKSKKFTPARMSAMKEVALQLMKLIGDVDGETAKDIMETIKEMPQGKPFASAVRAVGTSKAAESEVVEQLKEQNAELEKRLAVLEKTRMPSKSVDDDGGTDKKTVKKGLWEGVL